MFPDRFVSLRTMTRSPSLAIPTTRTRPVALFGVQHCVASAWSRTNKMRRHNEQVVLCLSLSLSLRSRSVSFKSRNWFIWKSTLGVLQYKMCFKFPYDKWSSWIPERALAPLDGYSLKVMVFCLSWITDLNSQTTYLGWKFHDIHRSLQYSTLNEAITAFLPHLF